MSQGHVAAIIWGIYAVIALAHYPSEHRMIKKEVDEGSIYVDPILDQAALILFTSAVVSAAWPFFAVMYVWYHLQYFVIYDFGNVVRRWRGLPRRVTFEGWTIRKVGPS